MGLCVEVGRSLESSGEGLKSNCVTMIRPRIPVNAALWFGHREHKASRRAQPRRGCDFLPTFSQGSSCLATLGFGTESRWDSRAIEIDFQVASGLCFAHRKSRDKRREEN